MPEGWIASGLATALGTLGDVLPIALIIVFFQVFVLRQPIPHLRRTIIGFIYVLLGLALFLIGLEAALFPLGRVMAEQLTHPSFIFGDVPGAPAPDTAAPWWRYYWIYLFAAAVGFATTVAEPALIAVAMKANKASAGALNPWGLRIAVGLGVSVSLVLGAFRIVTGTPLHWYMIAGYVIVVVQTAFAPRSIVPLAYDSGGVTTSTVTVPLVTALGLGLATTVPGRSALVDGFGLIALASLFPMITVMGYAQMSRWKDARAARATTRSTHVRKEMK